MLTNPDVVNDVVKHAQVLMQLREYNPCSTSLVVATVATTATTTTILDNTSVSPRTPTKKQIWNITPPRNICGVTGRNSNNNTYLNEVLVFITPKKLKLCNPSTTANTQRRRKTIDPNMYRRIRGLKRGINEIIRPWLTCSSDVSCITLTPEVKGYLQQLLAVVSELNNRRHNHRRHNHRRYQIRIRHKVYKFLIKCVSKLDVVMLPSLQTFLRLLKTNNM